MKIAVYSKPFFPRMGGLERNTQTLCLALKDLGHEVTLITETLSTEPDDYTFDVVRTSSSARIWSALKGSDFLFVNGNVALQILPMVWMRGIPYGIVYHSFLGYRRRGTGWSTYLQNAVRSEAARQAAANIFTSTSAKIESDVPLGTAHVVLNPVDKWLQRFYDEEFPQKKIEGEAPFLFAGRIIAGKGIFVLMNALEYLDGEHEVPVVIAGEGPAEEEVRRRVRTFETVQITLPGRLDGAELVSAYQTARALVVPSTTHKEGNPLVVAEAVYAGTPVIASDQPPMIESVDEAGIIVEQGNAHALAKALRETVMNKSYYKVLRQNAKQRANRFSYERYRDCIGEILRAAA